MFPITYTPRNARNEPFSELIVGTDAHIKFLKNSSWRGNKMRFLKLHLIQAKNLSSYSHNIKTEKEHIWCFFPEKIIIPNTDTLVILIYLYMLDNAFTVGKKALVLNVTYIPLLIILHDTFPFLEVIFPYMYYLNHRKGRLRLFAKFLLDMRP